ncbi:hypothetical protein B5807_11757 [Epicoccum nigrum]|uniref:Uncharacterized protein n=1 Tax=Epicoccum nigrum TaxID=105696 RepID=A0A1Y2LI53_EPING|nr:hypothetical protein B5807_11757 [Epicoccum nigrum]
MSLALRTLHHLALAARGVPPPPFPSAIPRHDRDDSPPPWAGRFDNNRDMPFDGKDLHSEETILFLFLSFGILIVLILILLLLSFQTYLSWRIAGVLVESADEEGGGAGGRGAKGLRAWRKGEKERKRALKMLEKRRSGVSVQRVGDEELGMTGARGSSLLLDQMKMKEEKKPFWKRWF